MNHIFARAALHGLRLRVTEVDGEREEFHRLAHGGRRLGLHQRAKFVRHFIHGFGAHAHGHAFVGAKCVDRDGEGRDEAIDSGLLEQQRFAAAGLFHFAVGDFGDFQLGGNRLGDTD